MPAARFVLFALILGLFGPAGAGARDISVDGAAALTRALNTAGAGDRLLLADGDYGDLALRPEPGAALREAPFTLRALHPGRARFGSVSLPGVRGLTLEGIAVGERLRADRGAARIAVRGALLREAAFRDMEGLVFENNRVEGGRFGLTLYSVRDFRIAGNSFRGATEDLVQISRASLNGLIENNEFLDVAAVPPAHPDLLQIYGYDGMTPGNITIRGNHFYDDPATGALFAQGIFLPHPGGQGFHDILIEQNLVSVRHANSIYVAGGQGRVVLRDNTLIAGPEGMKGGIIRLARGREGFDNSGVAVTGNLAARIVNETGRARLGDNYLYGDQTGKLFSGPGRGWRDFAPKAGTALPLRLSRYGAQGRIGELSRAAP